MSKSTFSCFVILILILVIAIPGLSQTRVGKLGIGVGGSMQYVLGAGTTNASPAFGGGVNFSYSMMEYLGVRGNFCYSPITWKGATSIAWGTEMMTLNLYAGSDLMPNSTLNVFPFIGGGLAVYDPRDNSGGAAPTLSSGLPVSSLDWHMIGGVSVDYFLNEFWSTSLTVEYVLTNSSFYAGSVDPNFSNDSYLQVGVQIRYYFFDSAFITKLLEAQRERSKRSK